MSELFLVSVVFAIICYRYDPKSHEIRWGVLLLICAALAGLSRSIIEEIIPALNEYNMNFPWLNTILLYARIVTGFISIYFFPWGVLMHAITYSEKFSPRVVKILTYVLILPIPVMLKTTVYFPDIKPDFHSMLFWAVPYIIMACLLHIYSYLAEKDLEKKRIRFTTSSIMLPMVLSALILNYITRAFDNTHQYWRYMVGFFMTAFFLFLWKALHRGGAFHGIKLRYERETRQNAMRAITSGTSLLNHTIKNQIYKINSSLQIMKPYNTRLDSICIESIDIIERSADHLMDMVDRIQSQTQEIVIQKSNMKLNQLLDEAVEHLHSELENKNLFIEEKYAAGNVQICCDGPHTKEVFINVLKNAIDAIQKEGRIRIDTFFGRSNEVIVKISDNGFGISPENIKHITEPFFTTKGNKGTNFGLGLSYCYDVMFKSGGKLEFESELNKGTTVILTFS
ncbi:sensor histidine kinase [Paenibacillus zanthoxyli]|uniref:sensor histidine kinase n=1 Tax=Paenibacillus zanthoxyli TaxID=369399 RepID=UPI0004707FAD|nr:HAMP domain-containing sensor histidine kinase [Paenibacillus zanthoxyli]